MIHYESAVKSLFSVCFLLEEPFTKLYLDTSQSNQLRFTFCLRCKSLILKLTVSL